jgi:hypothetical protein
MGLRRTRGRATLPAALASAHSPRSRRLVVIAALVATLVAGLGGWALGGAINGPPAPVDVPGDHLAAAGPLRLAVDGAWTPAKPTPELTGMRLADLSAYAPVAGLPGRTWIALTAIDGPTLVPAALRARLGQALPAPVKTKLAGHDAWAYRSLAVRGGNLLELTALPTSAGVLIVGCEAAKSWWSTVASCARAVRAVGGGTPLEPSADLAFRQALGTTMGKLNAARAGAGRALRRAGRARGQQAAARRLADAHRAAAKALAGLAPASGPSRRLVQSLSVSASVYHALARAAASKSRARYRPVRAKARKADAALRAALARATA